jgi:predicted small secreted protein
MMTLTRTLTALALALVVGGLAACNTIEGAGEDLESAGEAVENTAERAAN